jgi:hypothetical protein
MIFKACGQGWDKIIDPLILLCQENDVDILQIKEKFGRLRFYVSNSTPEVDLAIEAAEVLSAKTCEECGEPGKVRSSGTWLKTVCEKHAGKCVTPLHSNQLVRERLD